MPKYEVTSNRLAGRQRGDVVELDPAVNVMALVAAGHIKPAGTKKRRATSGNTRAD